MSGNWPKLEIDRAENAFQYSQAKNLFQQYADSLDFDLDVEGFRGEMDEFPWQYASPQGCILLAREEDQYLGCVALRPLGDVVCEMKRLFVSPDAQGRGIGRALVHELIRCARQIGYQGMRLDTVPSMRSARTLYRAFGFRDIESYGDSPIEGAIFMELIFSE